MESSDRLGLIRHDNSPSAGTEICVGHDRPNTAAVLTEAFSVNRIF